MPPVQNTPITPQRQEQVVRVKAVMMAVAALAFLLVTAMLVRSMLVQPKPMHTPVITTDNHESDALMRELEGSAGTAPLTNSEQEIVIDQIEKLEADERTLTKDEKSALLQHY
jgi:hypothetical protein